MNVENVKLTAPEKIAAELLNEKYKESFRVVEIIDNNIFKSYYTVVAFSERDTSLLFKAHVDDSGETLSDNYIDKLKCAELAEHISLKLDNLKGIFYMYSSPVLSNYMLEDANITLEEYIRENVTSGFSFYFYYIPDDNDWDNCYSVLQKAFEGLEIIKGVLHLYVMNEDILKSVLGYMENHDDIYYGHKKMVEPFSKGYVMVENCHMQIDKEEFINRVSK